MNYYTLLQHWLWRATSPFLAKDMPQQRVVIFHEIFAHQEALVYSLLSFLDAYTTVQATLTFDDGFYSSFRIINGLQDRKAIFFVCPEFISRAHTDRWKDFFYCNLLRTEDLRKDGLEETVRPASWDDLRVLVRQGHTIGSHTMTHARLSKIISRKELEREIIGSGDLIEDILQVKVDCFAYPFGDAHSIDERAYQIIKRRYRTCFTGIRGNNMVSGNACIKWRDAIDINRPLNYLSFLLQGGFDWYYASQRSSMVSLDRAILKKVGVLQ